MSEAYESLLVDLAAEQAALESVVAPVDADVLRTPTAADGWDVADTLAHLAGFDEAATTALTDPDAFMAELDRLLAAGEDPVAAYTVRGRTLNPGAVRDWWSAGRGPLLGAAAATEPKARIPWYGPPMSAMSFVTARLMETWAHGVDVYDALGAAIPDTDRLRHVAHIGVGARGYSYSVQGLEAPEAPISVTLAAPSGAQWQWGPPEADDRVEGNALDFALLVTQRRHRDDTALRIEGPVATQWMSFAQAFAGGAGTGRAPLS